MRELVAKLEQPSVMAVPAADAWRARVAVRTALGLSPWGILFALLFAGLGLWPVSASLLISACCVLSAPFLVPRVGLTAAGTVMTGGLVQSLLVPAWYTNGLVAGCFPWLTLCIVLGFVLSGPRVGAAWGVLTMGFAWLGFALHTTGMVPEAQVTHTQFLFLTTMAHCGLFSVVTVVMTASLSAVGQQQAALEEQRERAHHANLAKSQFLAKMSHELRTPMNAILGYSQMLREDASEADQADLARIEGAGKQLLDLVDDILDLSKVEAGEMPFSIAEVDVNELVEEVLASVRPLFAAADNELVVQVSAQRCTADARRLRQCLLNLLSNANKFTDAGRVTLTVEEQGGSCVFGVADTGTGMTEEQRAVVFDPFVQVHDGSIQGTGLGLAIVLQMVERMDGTVTVESEAGAGSLFRITLPI